jgi:putative hydrolase of the HAD superfamily
MKSFQKIRVVAFDADDTLWLNEPLFQQTQEKCRAVIQHYVDSAELDKRLYETERRNLKLFGYGVKGFILSMIETVIELSGGRISGKDIRHLIDLGKEMISRPIELLDGVEETVTALSGQYDLMIVTKGELFHQESKIARSGLAEYFKHIEIVSEKDENTYLQILNRHRIPAGEFLMIGNSLKSDIEPVCRIGGRAVHIPFHVTWTHEQVEQRRLDGIEYVEIENLKQLIPMLGEV